MRKGTYSAALTLLMVAAAACGTEKSSNPLSPSVAGPIPGVNITAPKLLQPAGNAAIDATAQPVTLVVQNANSSGVRPLTYRVEVAIDAAFANKVYAREGITPGGDGRTSLRLTDSLAADRTYYWHVRAQDGANTGPYSATLSFKVNTPITVGAPGLISPVGNTRLSSQSPTFVISAPIRRGPVGGITYTLQVANDRAFGGIVSQMDIREAGASTQKTMGSPLTANKTYYWRARAWEGSSRHVVGPWSGTGVFTTANVVAPPPDDPPVSSGPLPAPPYSTDGRQVIKRVSAAYPSYLRAGVSLETRKRNMAFLRDKVIEQGICGGMRLGWNWKRGKVGDKSVDYVTYFTGGRWIGVDIGVAYDDTRRPLQLSWNENPEDRYATYGGSPSPGCR